MENIAHTKVVAFDKTGTLTMGTPQVTDILTASHVSREQLLSAVASVEHLSMHPLLGLSWNRLKRRTSLCKKQSM